MKTPEEVLLFLGACKLGKCLEYIPKVPLTRPTDRFFLEKVGPFRFAWADENNVRFLDADFDFNVSIFDAESWLNAAKLVPLQVLKEVPEDLLWD